MASRRPVVLLALLATTGCHQGTEVTLTREPGGSLMVRATKADGGEACLTDASIYAAGSSPDAEPAWAVGRVDLRACATVFRVGGVTTGFEQRGAAPIQPGQPYCVAANGRGFADARPFVLGRDGRIEWLRKGGQDGC